MDECVAIVDAIYAIRNPQSAIAIAGHWRVRVVVGGARHHRRPALHQTQLAGQLADYRNGIRRRWVVRLPDQAARNRGLIPAGARSEEHTSELQSLRHLV